jgi:anti-anti-sigma factor
VLHATCEHNGSAVLVSASGEVDAANEGAWKQLLYEVAAITIAPGPVVIDIRHLDFMGACTYAALVREALRCRRRGVSLCLVSHKPIVRRIVAICGLRQMLPIYPTIQTALSCATAGPSWPVTPLSPLLRGGAWSISVSLRASCA